MYDYNFLYYILSDTHADMRRISKQPQQPVALDTIAMPIVIFNAEIC